MATLANRASSNASNGTHLRGQIKAIGIIDLLRVAISQRSTGRLLLFSHGGGAELHYEQGKMVAAVSGSISGKLALSFALAFDSGEFEYVPEESSKSITRDPLLHDILLLAIQQHDRAQVDSIRGGRKHAPTFSTTSGIHPVAMIEPFEEKEMIQSVPTSNDSVGSSYAPVASVRTRFVLAQGELGRAISDNTGRICERIGAIASEDTACAARLVRLGKDIASIFGFENLERLEVNRPTKSLLCRTANDGLRVARVNAEPDLELVWQGLEP
jgi:Domain of unknown function (DUF4388)